MDYSFEELDESVHSICYTWRSMFSLKFKKQLEEKWFVRKNYHPKI